jgi:hypothetical protein
MVKRRKNIYDPQNSDPYNISRSKIEFFLECPQCFYLDRRFGISRPDMPGWSLNSAVDQLLKNEFDNLRQNKQIHEVAKKHNINAIPFSHPDLAIWRDDYNKKIGASFLHKETNLNICGIIDDIWQNIDTKELHIVDYKSTSTEYPISLDHEYKQAYKRQMEVYQWIFRKLGHIISKTGYFFFANAAKNRPSFDSKLEFRTLILPHHADDSWVEPVIFEIKKCLDSDQIPEPSNTCQFCRYRKMIVAEKIKNKAKIQQTII